MEFVYLLPWLALLTRVITTAVPSSTSAPPTLRPHLWSPPLVDPLLCDSLQICNDTSSDVKYVKELCEHPRGAPANLTAPLPPSSYRKKRTWEEIEMRKSQMKPIEKKKMLEIHNYYRSRTNPQGGDMLFMKWDDYLADVAQMWAENCVFDHGFPEELNIVEMGQNLYIGHDPTGLRATQLWWEEEQYYHYDDLECDEDEQCGHYTQMAWADSESLGCGVSRCPKLGYYVVCHYLPQGNVPDMKPYTAGSACSQCWSIKDGALCHEGLCVSNTDCEEHNLTCSCNLTCHNCGQFAHPRYCRCICKRGWDHTDCSRPCDNLIDWCGEYPGWPDANSCHEVDYLVRDRYCRHMCHQCKMPEPDLSEEEMNASKEYCCAGQLCEDGWVLDTKTCECYPLCPGPACPSEETTTAAESLEESVEEVIFKDSQPESEEETTTMSDEEPMEKDKPAAPVRSSSENIHSRLWRNYLFMIGLYYVFRSVHPSLLRH